MSRTSTCKKSALKNSNIGIQKKFLHITTAFAHGLNITNLWLVKYTLEN